MAEAISMESTGTMMMMMATTMMIMMMTAIWR